MKFIPKKNKLVNKRELTKKVLPSHVPTVKVLEDIGITEEEVKTLPRVDSFLRGHNLPLDVDRNVIAANFNQRDQLEILFDTGEKIVTSAINIKEYVEQYVTVTQGEGGGAPLTWIDYVINWSSEPINLGAVTGGEKLQYTYPNGTLYRYVPSPYVPSQDAFYTDIDTTDLVISRGGNI